MKTVLLALLLGYAFAFFSHRTVSRCGSEWSCFRANPITSDGSNYGTSVTEDEAFQWFDEALLFVKGGSGGTGATTFKLGKDRQQGPPSGGSGGDGGSVIFEVCACNANASPMQNQCM
jgi:hypothetical protein